MPKSPVSGGLSGIDFDEMLESGRKHPSPSTKLGRLRASFTIEGMRVNAMISDLQKKVGVDIRKLHKQARRV